MYNEIAAGLVFVPANHQCTTIVTFHLSVRVIAERNSTSQLIWVYISANVYIHMYVVSRFRNVISHDLFPQVMFRNVIYRSNFHKYDAMAQGINAHVHSYV